MSHALMSEPHMATATYQDNPLQLRDKDDYSELTDKQAAVVDAVIDLGRDASNEDVAGVAGVSTSYAGAVRTVHDHIIADMIGAAPGENANGTETTEGVEDAVAQLDEQFADDTAGTQHISEAPKWSTDESAIGMEGPTHSAGTDDTLTVCLDLTGAEALAVLGDVGAVENVSDVWSRFDEQIVTQVRDQLLDRAGL